MKRSFLKLALASMIALPLLGACVTTEMPDQPAPPKSVTNLQKPRGAYWQMMPHAPMMSPNMGQGGPQDNMGQGGPQDNMGQGGPQGNRGLRGPMGDVPPIGMSSDVPPIGMSSDVPPIGMSSDVPPCPMMRNGEGPMGGPHMMARGQGGMQGIGHHPHHHMMHEGKPCPRMQAMMANGGQPSGYPCEEMAKKPVKKAIKKAAKKVENKPAPAPAETAPTP